MKFIFALLAVLALAAAADFQVQNPYITYPSDTLQTEYVSLKNVYSATLNSISYVLSCPDSGITFSYPYGLSYSVVGSILKNVVGYGVFYSVAAANIYTVNVNITYKRGSASTWSYEQHTVYIGVYDDDKREVLDANPSFAGGDDVADDVAADESDLSARTNNIYTTDLGFSAEDEVATWVALHSHTGTSALNSVTFTVVDPTGQVSINYPPSGNGLGSIAANTEKDSSFQVYALYNAIPYNLNITYKYKIGTGSYQYLSYSVPLSISCIGCKREVRLALEDDVLATIPEKQPFQYVYVVAAGAGVAVVAVVAIVGTLLYRRRSTETVSA